MHQAESWREHKLLTKMKERDKVEIITKTKPIQKQNKFGTKNYFLIQS